MKDSWTIERKQADGSHLRVRVLGDALVRVQIAPAGAQPDTALNRYGFIREPDSAGAEVSANGEDGTWSAATAGLTVAGHDGKPDITVRDASGRVLLHQVGTAFFAGGAEARFEAHPDEDWLGFGDQTRERLFHRGHVADCHVRNVRSYIPVPFFMSTRGVGVLVNTTYRVAFDLCAADPDHLAWRDGRGVVDYYVMHGDSFRALLDAYTRLSGRPKLPPEWAFGLWYICRTQANDHEVISDAVNFRREKIPCDVIGLEPGWMETFYDETTKKDWSKERFPIPPYARQGPHNFFNGLKRLGFRLELWLCNDYDLSYETARRTGHDVADTVDNATAGFYQDDAEQDAHFSAPRYLDKVTQRDEPWFEHLKKFVDQGVDFFKQDGAFQVLDHPDRLWGNGMTDREMHNLYPLLYVRQMLEGFEAHTGRRGLTFTPAGWTGFQAWAGTWTGDTGGRLPTLGAMLNTGIVGHSWMTNDMEVAQKEGIHLGYLLPWAQINSWNYFRMPWVQGDDLLAVHRDYANLRARLIPYLYAWAYHATQTGFPLLAALALEFENEPECRDVLHQYLLGRDLMVTAYEPEAYFPSGRWKDYWTGHVVTGPLRGAINWPDDRGGGLFVREGALIPLGPVMPYRGERPIDEMELYVFPGHAARSLDLYEDDGTSLQHRDGAFTLTPLTASPTDASVRIEVGAPQGAFDGQVEERAWAFRIAADHAPHSVRANGRQLASSDLAYDPGRGELVVRPVPGPVELVVTW